MIRADDLSHGLGRWEWKSACALQIHHQPAVRIAISEFLGEDEGERRLADAAKTPEASNGHALLESVQDIIELLVPAGKVLWRRRNLARDW